MVATPLTALYAYSSCPAGHGAPTLPSAGFLFTLFRSGGPWSTHPPVCRIFVCFFQPGRAKQAATHGQAPPARHMLVREGSRRARRGCRFRSRSHVQHVQKGWPCHAYFPPAAVPPVPRPFHLPRPTAPAPTTPTPATSTPAASTPAASTATTPTTSSPTASSPTTPAPAASSPTASSPTASTAPAPALNKGSTPERGAFVLRRRRATAVKNAHTPPARHRLPFI